MDKKRLLQIGVAGGAFLILAAYMERSNHVLVSSNQIERNGIGEGSQEVELELNASDILKDYTYTISVDEVKPTQEEAYAYFEEAKKEIDETFCKEGQDLSYVTGCVYPKNSYVENIVTAEWYFDDYDLIDLDGTLNDSEIDEEGVLLLAEAELSCDEFCESYYFSFMVYPTEKDEKEALLEALQKNINNQLKLEGTKELTLPSDVNGISLKWSEAKEHLVIKTLLIELFALIIIPIINLEKEKQKQMKRKEKMILQYPDMISKFTILVGAGMSVKQAWNKIAARYADKRNKNQIMVCQVYEEMLKTDYEIQDGESEKIAYERFGERIRIHAYSRFVRILIQNIQKGTGGLCASLEQESENAFEERRTLAKKIGEEAGTKMLIPLILMMGIVMAIVIMPAIIEFIV